MGVPCRRDPHSCAASSVVAKQSSLGGKRFGAGDSEKTLEPRGAPDWPDYFPRQATRAGRMKNAFSHQGGNTMHESM
jgi:hypothetical protein